MDFSIIIPAYNTEHLISFCLDSVIGQDYPNEQYEIIVVDDCSPNNVREVVKQKQHESSNIELFTTPRNIKQGGARNIGIQNAKGDYIIFLDSDDVWLRNDVLSTFSKIISQFGDVCIFDNKEYEDIPYTQFLQENRFSFLCNGTKSSTLSFEILKPIERIAFERSKNLINVWLSCYKKDFLVNNRIFFEEGVYYEDTDWRFRCIAAVQKIVISDFTFYGYRANPSSVTRKMNQKVLTDAIAASMRVLRVAEELKDCDKEMYHNLKNRAFWDIIEKPRFSRLFKLRDSRKAFAQLNNCHIDGIKCSIMQKIYFWIITHYPSILYIPYRVLYVIKCTF